MPHRAPTRAVIWVSLAVITGAAGWLRFHAIDAKSLWLDEGTSVAIARLEWYDFGRLLWRREANMSLYYLVLRGWLHGGTSETWIRGLSALFGILTVPVIYLIGKRLFSPSTGLVAALLLTVHALHIRYSQEARSYTLAVLLVSTATLLLLEALQRPARWKWSAYSAAAALSIYAHFYSVLVVVSHYLALRRHSESGRDFRRSLRYAALATAPVWIFIVATGAGPLSWLQRPTITGLREFLTTFAGNHGWVLVLAYSIAVIASVTTGVRAPSDERRRVRFLLYWLAFPIVTTLVLSFIRPVFLPRYMIVTLPALALLAGYGLALLPKTVAVPLTTGLVALSLAGTLDYYRQDFDIVREDWRTVTRCILDRSEPGDLLLFHTAQGRMPFEYYAGRLADHARQPRPSVLFPAARRGAVSWRDFMGSPRSEPLKAALASANPPEHVWLILSHATGRDRATAIIEETLAPAYHRDGHVRLSGIELRRYTLGRPEGTLEASPGEQLCPATFQSRAASNW